MTMLFDVSLERCTDPIPDAERTLGGNVEIINVDAAFFPTNIEFPLQLLMDAWWHMQTPYPPFAPGEGKELTRSPVHAEYEELNELFAGRKVRVDKEGYLLEENTKEVRLPKVKATDFYRDELGRRRGEGFDGESHYIMLAPKPAEFSRRAAEIITSFTVEDPVGLPEGRSIDDLSQDELGELLDAFTMPCAYFTATVSDARYLEHIPTGGVTWSTAFSGAMP
ncbi:hypothetical protein ACFOY2_48475 [Nonomuraea purpurea]|uniref:Uncharacterized protein n=1 Tax=Nonomuraea purpurea TaxID=1849276 RepID=A0ABV8GMF4_9ACTN